MLRIFRGSNSSARFISTAVLLTGVCPSPGLQGPTGPCWEQQGSQPWSGPQGAEDVALNQTGWKPGLHIPAMGLATTLSSTVVLLGSFPWGMSCDHQPNLKKLVLDL